MNKQKPVTIVVTKDNESLASLAKLLSTSIVPVEQIADALQLIERSNPTCVIVDFTVGREQALWLSRSLPARYPHRFSVGCLDSLKTLVGT